MLLRLLTTLVLTASASAAATRPAQPKASRQVSPRGAEPLDAGPKCRLTPRRSPALNGFRLGMTASQVSRRFPEFRDLARFRSADKQIEWKDASGALALGGGRSGLGVSVLRVEGDYFRRRLPQDAREGEFRRLDLRFLDGRLVVIRVSYWESPEWENTDGFRTWVERRYGLTPFPWRVTRPEKAPGVTYHDFASVTHTIDCDGFEIEANCVGPPAPPGTCDLEFRDSSVAKTVEARRRAAATKRE